MGEQYFLFTFESTHGAIATERLLKDMHLTVMPVPRAISASCGISIKVEPDNFDAAICRFRSESDLDKDEFKIYKINEDKKNKDFNFEIYNFNS